MMPGRRIALVLGMLATILSSGCGYALAGRGSFLPAYIRTIAIPTLENRSTFFQVEQVLTEKIRGEFIGRGKYQVLSQSTGGDAILAGEITAISLQPVALTEQQLASRYLFTLTMKVRFTDVRTNEVLWSNDTMTFREELDLATRGTGAPDGSAFIDQERSSFERVATDVARTMVTAIVEAF